MSTSNTKTILVLGGYGHAGCKIVKGLIEKTSFRVLATGRKLEKLDWLSQQINSDRLKIKALDAKNAEELKLCCNGVDMVINAVGPYSMGGVDVVKAVLECRKPYIDMANEQLHLNNLRDLKPNIEDGGSMVFTCTGQSPGVSTLVMQHMANMMDEVETIEMFGVVGRMPTPDQALASLMGGFIEPSLGSTTYLDGMQVNEPLGKFKKKDTMPEPFGEMLMLSFPLNDAILVPEVVKCKNVRTLFGLEMDLPPALFLFLRWLKPHKRKWAYRMLEKMVQKTLKDNYKKGLEEGFNPGGYMKVVVDGSDHVEGMIKVEDNAIMTSYMPIVIAINYFENPDRFKGLLTPTDVFTFESFNAQLDELGWKIDLILDKEPVKPIASLKWLAKEQEVEAEFV